MTPAHLPTKPDSSAVPAGEGPTTVVVDPAGGHSAMEVGGVPGGGPKTAVGEAAEGGPKTTVGEAAEDGPKTAVGEAAGGGPETAVIGWIDGRPVPRARLDARLAALRDGPLSSALPVPGTSEDRQLARWLTQVILTEALCESTATEIGLSVGPQTTPNLYVEPQVTPNLYVEPQATPSLSVGPQAAPAPPSLEDHAASDAPAKVAATAALTLDRVAAVELGSINAAAYNASPWVRAVFEHVTATVTVPEEWRRPPTPDQPPRHHVRHGLFDTLPDAQAATSSDLEPLGLITLESLPTAIAQALQNHPYDTLVGPIRDALGWHVAIATPPETPTPAPPHQTTVTTPPGQTTTITPSPGTTAPTSPSPTAATAPQPDERQPNEPQPDEPEGIVQTLPHPTSRPTDHDRDHDLLAAARRKAFARWLDDMRARKVTLVPGLEHPGDPRQPDNHHKH